MDYNITIQREPYVEPSVARKVYQEKSVVKIFITNENYKEFSFNPLLTNFKDIKWANRGGTNKYVPIKVEQTHNHQGIAVPRIKRLKDEIHNDGYAVISKKDFRLKNSEYIFTTGDELIPMLDSEVDRSIEEYNTLMAGNVFSCDFEWEAREDIVPHRHYSYEKLIADTPQELKCKIQDELDFLDDKFDAHLERACQEAFK